MKKTAALLMILALCGCAGRVRLYAVPLPPPPVDINKTLPKPMLPWVKCLAEKGSNSSECRSLEPPMVPGSMTSS